MPSFTNKSLKSLKERLDNFFDVDDTLYDIYKLFKEPFGKPIHDKDRIDNLQKIIDYETSQGYDCTVFQEILNNIKENGYRGLRFYEENGKYQIKINKTICTQIQ